jgi:signal transduction histidine kinase
MRERVESIGGEFRIRAVPGAGVRLSISLPLEEMR